MFNVIRLIDTVDEAGRTALVHELQTAAADSGADHALVRPTLPGVRNGGDVLMRLRFADEAQWRCRADRFEKILSQSTVAHVNGATYGGDPVRVAASGPGTVYRTLLLRVEPGTDDDTVSRFEDDLRLLPRYVTSICSWQLSRVDSAIGTSPWTHVFEQDFEDLDALTGAYLMHPIHWAYVDRWFDPECPDVIIRDRVCHSYCQAASAGREANPPGQ